YQQWWVWLIAAFVVIGAVVGIVVAVNAAGGGGNVVLKEVAGSCQSQTAVGVTAECSVSGDTLTVTISMDNANLGSVGNDVAAGMARIMWQTIHDEKNLDNFEVKVIYKADGKVVGEGTATSGSESGEGGVGIPDSYQDTLDKYDLDSDIDLDDYDW
ncbi:hypothetical protein, partial [Bifidobacterium cuniculi]